MPFVYENGEAVDLGSHGDHDYVFADGTPVPDSGDSPFVFEDGTGIGGGNIIDNLERGNLDPYDESNVPELFSVVTSPTFDGDYALRVAMDYNRTGAEEYIRSNGGLPYYPKKGDTFSFRYRPDSTDGDKCLVGWNWDGSEEYVIWINMSTESVNEEKVTLGRGVPSNNPTNIIDPGNNSWDAPADEWAEIEVDWGTDDVFTLTVYDANGNTVQGPDSGTDDSPLAAHDNFEWRHQTASTYGDRTDNTYFDLAKKKE